MIETLIITTKDTRESSDLINKIQELGLAVQCFATFPHIFVVRGVTLADFPFKDHPDIRSIEEDDPNAAKVQSPVTIEKFPDYGAWGRLRHINRQRPWNKVLKLPYTGDFECARTGLGVDIYILDTGTRATHDEFGGRVTSLDGFTPVNFHGTACASVAAGNTLGFATDSLIFSAAGLRNLDGSGGATEILEAMDRIGQHYYSRDFTNRPAVLSLSFISSLDSYGQAMSFLMNEGIVICAAAGNDRTDLLLTDAFPAEVLGAITVGGITMDDGPMYSSTFGTNFGSLIDILAASLQVKVAMFTGDSNYIAGNGTSFGTPIVAGMIACILQDYARPRTFFQMQAVGSYIYDTATFGEYQPDPRYPNTTPAIAYIDPGPGPYPPVPELVPYAHVPDTVTAAFTVPYVVDGPTPNTVQASGTHVYTIIQP